jgi:uncharacterized membrane protein YqjE
VSLLQPVQALLATALGLARTRLDLFSVELQEVLARLVLLVVGAVAAILLGALAVGFGAAALVLAAPEGQRVWVCAGLALAFLAGALYVAMQVRREAQGRPFVASLAELERDLQALKPRE